MTDNNGLATEEAKPAKNERALLLKTAPFIALVAVVAVAVLAGWVLVGRGWVGSSSDYVTLVGSGGFTGLGALAIAMLLHYRWMVDRKDQTSREERRLNQQDRLERERTSVEQRRHRDQERGKRQEKMGDRMAQAISHLGEGRGFMQVSGLIELAGLVDDWWSLGQEMLADMPDTDEAERERVREMIRQRRQEIIDLIFKHTLSPDGVAASNTVNANLGTATCDREAEAQRRKMVQEARSQVLTSHLGRNGDDYSMRLDRWQTLDLSRSHLKNTDLRNTRMNTALLMNSNLHTSRLSCCSLNRANLNGAILCDAEMIMSDLTRATAHWADFSGAKMEAAILSGASLEGAKFLKTDLNSATLIESKLVKADLTGAELEMADLSKSKSNGANLSDTYMRMARLIEASLTRANLTNAHLQGADFTCSNLRSAVLDNADLTDADFGGADLQNASLAKSTLYGTILQRTDLRGANLSESELGNYYHGSPIYDKDTKFPEGYDPEQSGFKLKDDD